MPRPTATRSDIEAMMARVAHDTVDHRIDVMHDDDLYKHLRFAKPGTSSYRVDIVTSPGLLTINGDMGTYVLSRERDMVAFFRSSPDRVPSIDYWAEKIVAGSGIDTYDSELAVRLVNETVEEFLSQFDEGEIDDDQRRDLMGALQGHVLSCADDEERFRIAAEYFRYAIGDHVLEFTDMWDVSLHRYTAHLMWCLVALPRVIHAYDQAVAERAAVHA